MSTSPVRHERRAAQRFEYQLPISVKIGDQEGEVQGFTQNLSARGAFFYTDCSIKEGEMIELTLSMPAEITLTENMRVRCRGKVLRIVRRDDGGRIGVAAQIERYEYLPDAVIGNADRNTSRLSSLHQRADDGEKNEVGPLSQSR